MGMRRLFSAKDENSLCTVIFYFLIVLNFGGGGGEWE